MVHPGPQPHVLGPTAISQEPDDAFLRDLEALFTLRRPAFIRSLRRFGVDVVEAEDITQEVFLRMCRPRSARPERLFEWLLACARNLAVTRFHRRRREVAGSSERWSMWERSLADPRCDTEVAYARRERNRVLAVAVAGLPPEQQRCLVLRSKGVTFRGIAELLDLPMRRVVYLTSLALSTLQARLADYREPS